MTYKIFEIEKEAFPKPLDMEELEEMAGDGNYIIRGEWQEEKLTGYIILLKMADVLEIIRIAVSKEFRRRGIGKKLVKKAVDISRELGYNSIWLEVREGNIGARELYKNEGFKEIYLRKKYYSDNGENAVVMELKF
jgi:ribosomal-protein-alanine N-acetyltransferase